MNKSNINQALQIFSNSKILILNSSFLNFTNSAIFILIINVEKMTVLISKSKFINNTAAEGSCLNIQGDITISIINCSFVSNLAKISKFKVNTKNLEGVAPCLYFKPKFVGSSKVHISNSLFENNIAEFIAPTIFSQNPIKFDNSTSFKNNKDGILFTSKAFSFPLEIKLLGSSSEGVFQNYLNLDDQKNVVEFNSGTAFYLDFLFRDDANQVLIFDNQSMFTIKKTDSSNSLRLRNFMNYSLDGKIVFSKIVISVLPNSNFNLELDGFFAFFPSEILNQKLKKTIHFHSRNCSIGEIITNDFSCVKCGFNTYSLADPMQLDLKFQKCSKCPDYSECAGGDAITPIQGYYRISNASTNMTPCLNAESCIGGINDTFCDSICMYNIKIHGGCKTGNSGILCSACVENYGKFNELDTCNHCATLTTLIIFRLIGYICFMCVYIFFNSYLAENYYHDSTHFKTKPNVFIQIIINHSQQLSVICFKGVQIPMGTIQSVFSFMDYISFTNEQVLSNDCLLQHIYWNMPSMTKIILNTLFPLILSSFALMIWFAIANIINRENVLRKEHRFISKFVRNEFSFCFCFLWLCLYLCFTL